MHALHLATDSFPEAPAFDEAVSRVLMERVAAGELPETLRLARPGSMVAFGRRDAASPGYGAAVAAARACGFDAVLRLSGGRAAVFHPETVLFTHAIPDAEPRSGIDTRFEHTAELMATALRRLAVDARVGEVPGEYCPGRHSVNARGRTKLVGVGQRLISGAAHVGGVVVTSRADWIRDVLVPVYAALGLDWDTATAGSVHAETPGTSWADVMEAIRTEYSARYELVPTRLDERTLQLAERYAPDHRCR